MYNGIIDWMEANYYDFLHSGNYVPVSYTHLTLPTSLSV